MTDPFFAAYVAYAGYEVMKCMRKGNTTTWVFLVPSCDFDIMKQEFYQDDRTVQSRSFTNSYKQMMSFQKAAQASGEFVTDAWREAIGISF